MDKSILRLAVCAAPLLLVGCGDGWEAQRTDTYLPYGNERTAGTGVVYVRAKMLQEKDLKLEPEMEPVAVEEKPAEPVPQPEPVLDAEEIFIEEQTKSGKVIRRKVPASQVQTEGVSTETPSASSIEDSSSEAKETAPPEEQSASEMGVEQEQSSADIDVPSITAEEYIAQPPKQIETPSVAIVETAPPPPVQSEAISQATAQSNEDVVATQEEEQVSSAAQGDAAAATEESAQTAAEEGDADVSQASAAQSADEPDASEESVVEVYEETSAQPVDEIVTPKRDFFNFKSQGEASLDEIYTDPF